MLLCNAPKSKTQTHTYLPTSLLIRQIYSHPHSICTKTREMYKRSQRHLPLLINFRYGELMDQMEVMLVILMEKE